MEVAAGATKNMDDGSRLAGPAPAFLPVTTWAWRAKVALAQHEQGGFQGQTRWEKMVEIGAFGSAHLLPYLPVLLDFELDRDQKAI